MTRLKFCLCWKRSVLILAVVALLLRDDVQVAADTVAVTVDNTTADVLSNPPFTLGWAFHVNNAMTVTKLGIFDSSQNGLVESYPVGIWDSVGNLLVSTTVASGTTDPLINQWRYHPVAPTTLTAGQDYAIGALYLSSNDDMVFPGFAINFASAPAISFVESRYDPSGSLNNPTFLYDGNPGFFGPNFTFAVPEASTIILLCIGIGVVSGSRLQRMKGAVIASTMLAAAFWVTVSQAAVEYSVTDLGTLGGSTSRGIGINDQGWVAGRSSTIDGFTHAFLHDGTMHDLGTLGGTFSRGEDINDAGVAIGWATLDDDTNHAFLYDGVMHDLGTLGGTNSEGHGINNAGLVTGWAEVPGDETHHAFLYDGVMHDLGTLGGTYSAGNGINNSGWVTGVADVMGIIEHAFLYDGTMHDLGTLGGTYSYGNAINDTGLVTGGADAGGGVTHAFLYDGTMHDLGTLGGTESQGNGINNLGQIVGDAYTIDDFQHAFLYTSETGTVDLNTLIDPLSGWELVIGYAINDAGQITGWGYIGGERHAFLLTPVPEPATTLLAVLAVLAISSMRLRC